MADRDRQHTPEGHTMRVILGAGSTTMPGWVATRQDQLDVLNPADFQALLGDELADAFLAEHVWEHMIMEDGIRAAANCFAHLKPGGYMRVAVPDANFRNEAYQQMVQIGGPGDPDHPAASHKIVYDYRTLAEVFTSVGFEVRLLEYCDEQGDFHYSSWNPADGMIGRSYRFDTRNQGEQLGMVSVIIDAYKMGVIPAPNV